MAVPYYIGAKAIAERLGYKNPKTVTRLAIRAGLPIYKRVYPLKTGGTYRTYAISESAITAWELVQGQRMVAKLQERRAAQEEKKKHALTP